MLPNSQMSGQIGPTSLESAIERQNRRSKPIPKVAVKTVEDIRRVLSEFDPVHERGPSEVDIKSMIDVEAGGSRQAVPISAKCVGKSRRQIIVEAFNAIQLMDKKQNAINSEVMINGRSVPPVKLPTRSYIDPIIEQWFDAKRDGQQIYWELTDGYRYNYDPITHKLTRTQRQG